YFYPACLPGFVIQVFEIVQFRVILGTVENSLFTFGGGKKYSCLEFFITGFIECSCQVSQRTVKIVFEPGAPFIILEIKQVFRCFFFEMTVPVGIIMEFGIIGVGATEGKYIPVVPEK